MTEQDQYIREMSEGAEAAALLHSPVFATIRERITSSIHSKMRSVPIADEKMHTRLILLLQCWQSIETYLEQTKQTGKLAEFEVEKKNRFLEQMRTWAA